MRSIEKSLLADLPAPDELPCERRSNNSLNEPRFASVNAATRIGISLLLIDPRLPRTQVKGSGIRVVAGCSVVPKLEISCLQCLRERVLNLLLGKVEHH